MQIAVCIGDVKQNVQYILQHLRAVGINIANLAGISVETGNIFLRQPEYAHHIGVFGFRYAQYALHGLNLNRRHNAVGTGHFGRQRDERNGENHLTVINPVENKMPGHAPNTAPGTPPIAYPAATPAIFPQMDI